MSEVHTCWVGPRPDELHIYIQGRHVSIPMGQFSRYDNPKEPKTSEKICRWFFCKNRPAYPFREYCSQECKDKFESWYWRMYWAYFSWEQVKTDVFKRDKGRCTMCKRKLDREAPPQTETAAEFDHILPEIVAIEKLKLPFWQYVRMVLLNRSNVRTLCHPCHKKVTAAFNSKRLSRPHVDRFLQRQLEESALEGLAALFPPLENTLLAYY